MFNATMYAFIRSTRWGIASVVVVAMVGLFVNLGLWQLRRNDERRLDNTVGRERLAAPPMDLGVLLAAVDLDTDSPDLSSLEWRRTVVRGTYLPELEVLVRSSVNSGRAGFEVVTPLRLEDGDVVVVDRGWVPLEFDDPPVPATPPDGVVVVEGVVRLGKERPAIGAVDPPPPNEIISRIDLDWFRDLVREELTPVWIQRSGESTRLPIPADVPAFDDPGPHLAYAIQWFAFAVIAIVGYLMLIRSNSRRVVRRK